MAIKATTAAWTKQNEDAKKLKLVYESPAPIHVLNFMEAMKALRIMAEKKGKKTKLWQE